jgi:hypothetical protein
MLYRMRHKDGGDRTRSAKGTLVAADGQARALGCETKWNLQPLGEWRQPKASGDRYPAQWRLAFAGRKLGVDGHSEGRGSGAAADGAVLGGCCLRSTGPLSEIGPSAAKGYLEMTRYETAGQALETPAAAAPRTEIFPPPPTHSGFPPRLRHRNPRQPVAHARGSAAADLFPPRPARWRSAG